MSHEFKVPKGKWHIKGSIYKDGGETVSIDRAATPEECEAFDADMHRKMKEERSQKTIHFIVNRPEGYEDVADELVLEDFMRNPQSPAWSIQPFVGFSCDRFELNEEEFDKLFKTLSSGVNSTRETLALMAEGEGDDPETYKTMAKVALDLLDKALKPFKNKWGNK